MCAKAVSVEKEKLWGCCFGVDLLIENRVPELALNGALNGF